MSKVILLPKLTDLWLITIVIFCFGLFNFSLWEAGIASAQGPARTVVVKQQVLAEISFELTSWGFDPPAVINLGVIPGLTGGISGQDWFGITITTNNNEGYTVTVQASSTGQAGVLARNDGPGYFNDYPSDTPVAWQDSPAGGASRFGFEVRPAFVDGTPYGNPSSNQAPGYGNCPGGSNGVCYSRLPTSTPKVAILRNIYTQNEGDMWYTGFRAQIPANSNPLVPEGWYTATTTWTAFMN